MDRYDPYTDKFLRDTQYDILSTNLAQLGTDCISRQAAMKLLRDDWQASESRGDAERAEIAKFHFIEISNLPAAQPEPCEDDPRADVYYLAEKIGIHQLYAFVVQLRGEPEPCEDAVSRKAAIDAILGQPPEPHYPSWYAEQIKQLPPAQPKPNYDEWCTNCKEYDHENSCCPRWTKVIRQTRRELQDEFVMTAVDGTLWVTVDDVQKVGRVIVDEGKSKFCRQFYMDAQPEQRTGRWIPRDHNKRAGNISTCVYYYPTCSECGQVGNETYKYCPHCGAKMTEGDAE